MDVIYHAPLHLFPIPPFERKVIAETATEYVEIDGPLSFDLDTPEDLLEADRRGFGHEDGR